jgi:hypothetical protein
MDEWKIDHTNDIVLHGQKERITRMNVYNMDKIDFKKWNLTPKVNLIHMWTKIKKISPK